MYVHSMFNFGTIIFISIFSILCIDQKKKFILNQVGSVVRSDFLQGGGSWLPDNRG